MSKKAITATIVEIEHIDQSASGNPRYTLKTDEGKVYRTKPDTSCAYAVSSYPEVEGFGRRYTLTLDGRGMVIGIDEA